MNIKKKIQLLLTLFVEKYDSMALYDEDLEKFIIDHEQLQFDKYSGCTLITIPKN